jgi:hypothetical protein
VVAQEEPVGRVRATLEHARDPVRGGVEVRVELALPRAERLHLRRPCAFWHSRPARGPHLGVEVVDARVVGPDRLGEERHDPTGEPGHLGKVGASAEEVIGTLRDRDLQVVAVDRAGCPRHALFHVLAGRPVSYVLAVACQLAGDADQRLDWVR